MLDRRNFTTGLAIASAATVIRPRRARADKLDKPIKVAVVNDQTSVYSASGGVGTVACVKLAIEDVGARVGGVPVELMVFDHQNKADVGASIAEQAYDVHGVDAIFDIGNSAISLAVQEIARKRGKILVNVGSAHEALYGRACAPTCALWTYDTYSLAHGLTQAIYDQGGTSWFFITADYAFGTAMQAESTKVLEGLGGKVVGSVRHPIGASDFSAYLLQASTSGATTIALANASADTVNCAKQAFEFGIGTKQKLATLIFYLTSVHELGGSIAGLQYLESFYWDRDDRSRRLGRRYAAVRGGAMPTQTMAGNYSAVGHYLKAVAATGSRDGLTVMRAMKAMPVDDDTTQGTLLRADGRLMKDYYLVQVKKPADVREGWDLLDVRKTVPADTVIRSLADGGCKAVDPAT